MNNQNKRTFAGLLFILIFFIKMIILVVPLFSISASKASASVILQLEQKTDAEKDTTDKDICKEKKDFDEHLYTSFSYLPLLLQTAQVAHIRVTVPLQRCKQAVPTPPPNA